MTKQNVYFAGDTAQTIAKGVGARFTDLQTLLKQFNTKVIQLTTNYRSHGQILDLANSVVSLLETLFPYSIDKLAKEKSETKGMLPLILNPLPKHILKQFFTGKKEG
jgi:superfamily I DNA/RNA helicase